MIPFSVQKKISSNSTVSILYVRLDPSRSSYLLIFVVLSMFFYLSLQSPDFPKIKTFRRLLVQICYDSELGFF